MLRSRRVVGALVGAPAALLALGPGLAPGFLLFYDMVFVPDLALSERTLGTDGSVPRAVPNDVVVALLSLALPGWVVQKLLLVLVLVGVGAGVAGLVRTRLAAAVAALVACWNPYVAERLAIGHWGFLLGYAVLPWVATSAAAARDGTGRDRLRLGGVLLLATLTGSTGSVLALLLALVVLAVPGGGASVRARLPVAAWAGVCWLLLNAVWWLPFMTITGSFEPDPGGVAAFRSRADTPYGVVGSLLTGGGIWNQGVWLPDRQSVVLAGVALVLVVACVAVWCASRGWRAGPAQLGVAVTGAVGLAVAALSAVGGGALVESIVLNLPGGGLLRDSQKFVALWMVFLALAAGVSAERLRALVLARGGGRAVALALGGAVGVASLLTLPSLAWGATGRWTAVDYPADHRAVAAQLEQAPPGAVAVFPWTLYRRYAWNDQRVVLDPWQRLLSRQVVVNDDLPLSDRVVRGEDPTADAIGAALRRGGDTAPVLREHGIRYALVLADQPPGPGVPRLPDARVIASTPDLRLYDLGPVDPARAEPSTTHPPGWISYAIAGSGVICLLLGGTSLLRWRSQRKTDADHSPAR